MSNKDTQPTSPTEQPPVPTDTGPVDPKVEQMRATGQAQAGAYERMVALGKQAGVRRATRQDSDLVKMMLEYVSLYQEHDSLLQAVAGIAQDAERGQQPPEATMTPVAGA